MTNSLHIALVTGANKGIGYEVAAELARRGMRVVLTARDARRRDAAVARLAADALDVIPVPLDVTDQRSVQTAADTIDHRFGRLDVLINNAGISGGAHHPPDDADLDILRSVLDTNLIGVIQVTNAMLPLLRRSPAARIVNVSSVVGSLTCMTDPNHDMSRLPASIAYPTSKSALNALTVQYAKQLKPEGILINVAAPGACATDLTKDVGIPIPRTATDGARVIVKLATLGPNGPTGGFFDEDGIIPW